MVECLCPQNPTTKSYPTANRAELELEHYYYKLMSWKKEDTGECYVKGWVRFHNKGDVLLKNLEVYLDVDDEADFYDVDFWSPSSEGPDKKVIKGPNSLLPDHWSGWHIYYLKLHHNHGFPLKAQHFTGKIDLAPNYEVEFPVMNGFVSHFNGVIE